MVTIVTRAAVTRAAIAGATVLFAITRPCAAQGTGPVPRSAWVDSGVPHIMARARTGFPDDVVVDILRQRSGPQPAAKRDELADSIVALAIRTPGAISAVAAIAGAGIPGSDVRMGTADPRAIDWLVRIHRDGQDVNTRNAALAATPNQMNRVRAAGYLRDVAMKRDDATAMTAVILLISIGWERMGSFSESERLDIQAQLREMWVRSLVTNALATVQLQRLAAFQNWPKRPPS